MSKKITKKVNNTERLKCASCEYWSKAGAPDSRGVRGVCILFSAEAEKINKGMVFHLLARRGASIEVASGEFHTNEAQRKGFKQCPRWTDPKEVAAIRKISAAAKEKERRAFMDKVRACGSKC